MQDLISRQAAIDAVYKCSDIFAGDMPVMVVKADAYEALAQLPSADVAQVRHGRWVVIDAEEPRRYGCSECKRLSWHMENYCGNCGARMDGDEDEIDRR